MEITFPNHEVGFQYLLARISPMSEMKSMQDTCVPGCVFFWLTWRWGQLSSNQLCSWFLITDIVTKQSVGFASCPDLSCMWVLQLHAVTPGGITCDSTESVPCSQLWNLSSSDRTLWSEQTLVAKTTRCWFCCICAWYLLLTQTNYPNGPRPSFRPKH